MNLSKKYGWRYLAILVYDNVATGDNHWNWGDQFVDVYHKYNKNVVVHYRGKTDNMTSGYKACKPSELYYFVGCNDELWRAKDVSTWTLGTDFEYWKYQEQCKGKKSAMDCQKNGKTICNSHVGFCDQLYALTFVHKSANLAYSIDEEMKAEVLVGNSKYEYASTGIAFLL